MFKKTFFKSEQSFDSLLKGLLALMDEQKEPSIEPFIKQYRRAIQQEAMVKITVELSQIRENYDQLADIAKRFFTTEAPDCTELALKYFFATKPEDNLPLPLPISSLMVDKQLGGFLSSFIENMQRLNATVDKLVAAGNKIHAVLLASGHSTYGKYSEALVNYLQTTPQP